MLIDSKEAVNRDWRVLELNVLIEVLPQFLLKARRSDEDEVVNIDNELSAFRMIEVTWRPVSWHEAALSRASFHFLIPNGSAFGVAIEGFFENADRVTVLRAAVGVIP